MSSHPVWCLLFGGGVADNQNLALIFESEGDPAASGLGVALFSLASTLSRVSVGVLSDRYSETLSRFGWLIIVAFLGVVGQVLLSVMSAPLILAGTFVCVTGFQPAPLSSHVPCVTCLASADR